MVTQFRSHWAETLSRETPNAEPMIHTLVRQCQRKQSSGVVSKARRSRSVCDRLTDTQSERGPTLWAGYTQLMHSTFI